MKIAGVDPSTLSNEHILVLPRDDGKSQIVFRACGVPDWDEFDKLCPEPQPPGKLTKDGFVPDDQESGYLAILANYHKQRLAWLIVKSLEPSDIEWDTVKLDNPSTWNRWESDLKKAGFSQTECGRVRNLVFKANSLSEEYLEEAREVFLRGQRERSSESSGPTIEPKNTPSGKHA